MELIPFPGDLNRNFPGPLSLHAHVTRTPSELLFQYQLSGPALGQILIPSRKLRPERISGLWQSTCFEAFVRISGRRNYWEFNFSPSGEWNCFAFSEPRQGMREERSVREIRIQTDPLREGQWTLKARVPLDTLDVLQTGTLEMGLTAVLESVNGLTSHWAIAHHQPKPDFHDPASFELRLPEGESTL